MTLGSPDVEWSRTYLRKLSALRRVRPLDSFFSSRVLISPLIFRLLHLDHLRPEPWCYGLEVCIEILDLFNDLWKNSFYEDLLCDDVFVTYDCLKDRNKLLIVSDGQEGEDLFWPFDVWWLDTIECRWWWESRIQLWIWTEHLDVRFFLKFDLPPLFFSWWWCDLIRRSRRRWVVVTWLDGTEGRSEWASPRMMTLLCYHVKYQNSSWRWQWQERRTQNPWEGVKRGQPNQTLAEIQFWEVMQWRWIMIWLLSVLQGPVTLKLLTWATWGHVDVWVWTGWVFG